MSIIDTSVRRPGRAKRALAAAPLALAAALATPAHADDTPECNVGPGGLLSTECGVGASATGTEGTAVGNEASADTYGTSVGTRATTAKGGTGIGLDAEVGADAVGIGAFVEALGSHSVAIGGLGPLGVFPRTTAGAFGATAVGAGSQAMTTYSTAIGANASAGGDVLSTAVGFDTIAISGATALGSGAIASSAQSTALGLGSQATGQWSTAIGGGRGGYSYNFTLDPRVQVDVITRASGIESTAVGGGAQALGDYSTVLGSGAQAGYNSVALGFGSLAIRENTVAIGGISPIDASSITRQLTGLAAGSEATDAVNVAQLGAVATLAANAQSTADIAEAKADAAQTTANSALIVANTAQGSATAAQATADAALANAGAAQATADTARVEAAAAQGSANIAQTSANTAQASANAAQATANTAVTRGNAMGASTAAALGGGASYDTATATVSAPRYTIAGQDYGNVGSALAAVDSNLSRIDGRVGALEIATGRGFDRANGGIAAAMALGGTMIVPDSQVSASFNLSTYRGQQGFSGAIAVRAAQRVYLSGGIAGSTVKGSTGGRVGVAFGF